MDLNLHVSPSPSGIASITQLDPTFPAPPRAPRQSAPGSAEKATM